MESAGKELLANISHNLRTPQTIIKGYAEMVKEFSWEDEGKREHDLSIIMRETDRLTAADKLQTGTKAVLAAVSPVSGGLGQRLRGEVEDRPQAPCEGICGDL